MISFSLIVNRSKVTSISVFFDAVIISYDTVGTLLVHDQNALSTWKLKKINDPAEDESDERENYYWTI